MWIAGAGCTLLHGRSQPRAHSSPCPPPPAAGCAPSPWPPQPGCASRHGQAATGHRGGEFVLEPRDLLEPGIFLLDPPFFLLQPLCFLLPSPFDLMNSFRFCWNRCPDLLEPVGGGIARLTPRRRKLHPAVKSVASNAVHCRELQACMSELRPTTRGAARGEAIFANVFSFCRTNFLFLQERCISFAGTEIILCFNDCRALKCSCCFCWKRFLFCFN